MVPDAKVHIFMMFDDAQYIIRVEKIWSDFIWMDNIWTDHLIWTA